MDTPTLSEDRKKIEYELWQVYMSLINDGDLYRELNAHMDRRAAGGAERSVAPGAHLVFKKFMAAAMRECSQFDWFKKGNTFCSKHVYRLIRAVLDYHELPRMAYAAVDDAKPIFNPYVINDPKPAGSGDAKDLNVTITHIHDFVQSTIPRAEAEATLFKPATQKETTMSQIITVTTKTFVNGADVAQMSDEVIYNLIAEQEAKIAELSKIQNKPIMLQVELDKRQAGVKALVDYLDSKVPDDVKASLVKVPKVRKASKATPAAEPAPQQD